MVEVDEERLKVLASGARWVSLSSAEVSISSGMTQAHSEEGLMMQRNFQSTGSLKGKKRRRRRNS